MQPGAATNLLVASLGAGLAVLAACASTEPAPARLSAAQVSRCRAVEAAYRSQAPEYPALRDEVAQDPVAATWLVRMFVSDLFRVREGRPLGEDDELLASAARIENPVEVRALAEIRGLGAVAVPTLIRDLLQHEQPQPRELGVELLAHIGAPAVPALQQIVREGESRHRRAAARALGGIGGDPGIFATLRELAGDADYTVRADALRSLRTGGEPARLLLLERLRDDADPFVRRVAAQTLSAFRSTATALALVDYLERCKREEDWPGQRAAQRSLMQFAGSLSPRTPAAWRAWAPQLDQAEPPPAIKDR